MDGPISEFYLEESTVKSVARKAKPYTGQGQ